MALSGYKYHYNGIGDHDKNALIKEHKYAFKTSKNISYIVNVEQYKHEVFVLKFHLKKHSDSPKKYNLLLFNSKDHYKNYKCQDARKVLHTCVLIGKEIASKHPHASFGFIGMPTIHDGSIEPLKETPRYQLYQKLAYFFFKEEHYEHRRNKDKSVYLLLNKKKIEKNPNILNDITKMFMEAFNIDEIYANLVLIKDSE